MIIFNPYSDGQTNYNFFANSEVSFGNEVLGPIRLIAYMESRLGLKGPEVDQDLRIEEFKVHIEEWLKSHPEAYFSKSFHLAPTAVAEQVLNIMDKLQLSGVALNGKEGFKGMLDELSDLNCSLPESFPSGLGGRIQKILSTEGKINSDIHLAIDPSGLHPTYKSLLSRFNSVKSLKIVKPLPEGDLQKLSSLLEGSEAEFSNDETVQFYHFSSKMLAARLIADYLTHEKKSVIISEEKSILNSALKSAGLPYGANDNIEGSTSSLELLRLIPCLFSNPCDALSMLSLMQVDESFIPNGIRSYMVGQLIKYPGRDHDFITKTCADYISLKKKNNLTETDPVKKSKTEAWLKSIEKRCKTLFKNTDVEDPEHIDIKKVTDVLEALASWSKEKKENWKGRPKGIGYSNLYRHSKSVISDIRNNYPKHISLSQLISLIDQALEGTTVPGHLAEVSHVKILDTTYNLFEQEEHVILFGRPNVSNAEFSYLPHQAAIQLKGKFQDIHYKDWTSIIREFSAAVNHARKLWVITYNQPQAEDKADPIKLYIKSRSKGFDKISRNFLHTIDDENYSSSPFNIKKEKPLILPARTTIWEIDAPAARWDLLIRKKESASSLEKLIDLPQEYFMKYILDLNEPQYKFLPNTFEGNLSEKIIYSVLEKYGNKLQPKSKQIEETILNSLKLNGSLFLSKSQNAAKIRFVRDLTASISKLSAYIIDSKLQIAKSAENGSFQHAAEKVFGKTGVKIGGYLDLLLETQSKQPGKIIDIKAANREYKKFTGIIKEDRDFQAAVYSFMKSNDTQFVPMSYYEVRSGKMIARTHGNLVNPDSSIYVYAGKVDQEKSMKILMKKLEVSYNARLEQFKKGIIECPMEDAAAATDYTKDVNVIQPKSRTFPDNNYALLTGLIK